MENIEINDKGSGKGVNKIDREKGFTLVELLVVISILGLLAMVTIPRFDGFRERGIEAATLAELQAVRQAWNYYEIENGKGSLNCEQDLGVFLGEDLQASIFLERYQLDFDQDGSESHISASIYSGYEGEGQKQRSEARIYLHKISFENN